MPKNEYAFDVETTTINNGDPFHPDNRLVAAGIGNITYYKSFEKQTQDELKYQAETSILVGHNIKFDLAWLRRACNIDYSLCVVRDTQLAEFILSNQTHSYASLNELAEKYLGENKLDVVKTEYWDKGIDTWFVPENILIEYLYKDLELTKRIHDIQKKLLQEQGKWNLYIMQCADLLTLADMEYNGILYQKEKSVQLGNDLQAEIDATKKLILNYTSCPSFNSGSGDHLSCLLYGGTIIHTERVPVGEYKSGAKIGQTRYKLFEKEYVQPRLVEPLKGSELKKVGYWSVDETTLRSLKPTKEVKVLITKLLEISKLEKLQSTYYWGIPKLMDKKAWENNIIHGKLNQCVARTGRLSASEPNQQNLDPKVQQLCVSRYD